MKILSFCLYALTAFIAVALYRELPVDFAVNDVMNNTTAITLIPVLIANKISLFFWV